MDNNFDIIVVGGGIVGLTAALAMQQRNFSVALLDKGPLHVAEYIRDVRVYALNQASQTLLMELGVWQQMDAKHIGLYRHMHIWDASNGAYIDFDAREVNRDKLGTIIEDSTLKQALLQQAIDSGVNLFPYSHVSAATPTTTSVQVCSNNHTLYGKLLLVADGATSPTRQLLRAAITTWSYHQHAVVATVQTTNTHKNTAYQVFNADGPLAFLPLSDSKQCAIVWSMPQAKAQRLLLLGEDEFNQQLTNAFYATLGDTYLVSARHQFPLHMRHAKQYYGLRWLLMGDAAHSIHPLAGLGLNIGLADVATLLANLSPRVTPWSKVVLSAYQRQRKNAVWQVIAGLDSLKALFANPTPLIARLRGLGLQVSNNFLPLKRMLIRYATGSI